MKQSQNKISPHAISPGHHLLPTIQQLVIFQHIRHQARRTVSTGV
jgi:hypothetical protein